MLVRGFAAESFGDGGSAFTKNCRPSSFRTLAICAFAPFAKNDAKKIAQEASVVLISPAVFAVRLIISTVTPVLPGLPRGRRQQFWNLLHSRQFSTLAFYRQCSFRTRPPHERSTRRVIAWRWLVLLLRAHGNGHCLP